MKIVVEHMVCEIHPDSAAKLEGFKFFWPPTGKTYMLDPCEICGDPITAALTPFIQVARSLDGDQTPSAARMSNQPETDQPESTIETPPRKHRATEPMMTQPNIRLPRGMQWWRTLNGSGEARGRMNHVTRDKATSRCGRVSPRGETKWIGPPEDGIPYCRKCVIALQMDERQRAEAREKAVRKAARLAVKTTGKETR